MTHEIVRAGLWWAHVRASDGYSKHMQLCNGMSGFAALGVVHMQMLTQLSGKQWTAALVLRLRMPHGISDEPIQRQAPREETSISFKVFTPTACLA